jgi:hypothetical protein
MLCVVCTSVEFVKLVKVYPLLRNGRGYFFKPVSALGDAPDAAHSL